MGLADAAYQAGAPSYPLTRTSRHPPTEREQAVAAATFHQQQQQQQQQRELEQRQLMQEQVKLQQLKQQQSKQQQLKHHEFKKLHEQQRQYEQQQRQQLVHKQLKQAEQQQQQQQQRLPQQQLYHRHQQPRSAFITGVPLPETTQQHPPRSKRNRVWKGCPVPYCKALFDSAVALDKHVRTTHPVVPCGNYLTTSGRFSVDSYVQPVSPVLRRTRQQVQQDNWDQKARRKELAAEDGTPRSLGKVRSIRWSFFFLDVCAWYICINLARHGMRLHECACA